MSVNHPCFDRGAHLHFGRMHLPVAPRCNIQCAFCDRRHNCLNESRPGVAARVLTPIQACELALRACEQMPNISVAGIAGPGDPLANPDQTLETLRLLRQRLPNLLLCLSTNGLALPDHIHSLASLGVHHITVTVNAIDPEIGAHIYNHVNTRSGRLVNYEGAEYLRDRQLTGIAQARELGLAIKVNMVIIPGINDAHTGAVARQVAEAGADLMNCIPLSPVAGTPLGNRPEPSPGLMESVRAKAEKYLPQMRHCGRCRADALGMLREKYILEDLTRLKPLQIIKQA